MIRYLQWDSAQGLEEEESFDIKNTNLAAALIQWSMKRGGCLMLSRGPEVDPAEDLYRAVTVPDWWNPSGNPPLRSAAFSWPKFSVNIASLMTPDEAIRHLREVLKCPNGGIVTFNCGDAKALGFDPRREIDPQYPKNLAHANVYSDGSRSKRKTRAKQLAVRCCHQILLEPSF